MLKRGVLQLLEYRQFPASKNRILGRQVTSTTDKTGVTEPFLFFSFFFSPEEHTFIKAGAPRFGTFVAEGFFWHCGIPHMWLGCGLGVVIILSFYHLQLMITLLLWILSCEYFFLMEKYESPNNPQHGRCWIITISSIDALLSICAFINRYRHVTCPTRVPTLIHVKKNIKRKKKDWTHSHIR